VDRRLHAFSETPLRDLSVLDATTSVDFADCGDRRIEYSLDVAEKVVISVL
jgi:hypothetical protein